MIVLYAYNEALMKASMEDPIWKDWAMLSERANIQAESNPDYVGRYKGELEPFGYIAPRWPHEPLIMGNLSAWRSREALFNYTFGPGVHGGMIKNRSRWFEPWTHDRPRFVAWYGHANLSPNGTINPLFDLDTAMLMQAQLGEHGPDANCFGWGR